LAPARRDDRKDGGWKILDEGGIGSASIKVGNTGVVVGAIVAVNAVGDIWNPKTAKIVAGARSEDGKGFRDAMAQVMKGNRVLVQPGANTTIGLVATNVAMEKVQIAKVAQMAHDGMRDLSIRYTRRAMATPFLRWPPAHWTRKRIMG